MLITSDLPPSDRMGYAPEQPRKIFPSIKVYLSHP